MCNVSYKHFEVLVWGNSRKYGIKPNSNNAASVNFLVAWFSGQY